MHRIILYLILSFLVLSCESPLGQISSTTENFCAHSRLGDDTCPNSVGQPPKIDLVGEAMIAEDASASLPFSLSDTDTILACSSNFLSAVTSNEGLVPASAINFSGQIPECFVNINPLSNQNGSVKITLTVNDGSNTASSSFNLTVSSVNDLPVISPIGNETTYEGTPSQTISFQISDIDSTLDCSSSLSMESSDTAIVQDSSVVWSGDANNCSAIVTPEINKAGLVNLKFKVTDGQSDPVVSAFELNVIPKPITLSGGAYQFSDSTFAKSCKGYRDSIGYDSEGSGHYWIDPDESGPNQEMMAYCDMVRDGGGWTLVANRRGGSTNVESCGVDLNGFFQNSCGDVLNIGFGNSYNLGGSSVRQSIIETGEWLFVQNSNTGVVDSDDAFIIHHNQDLFPSSVGVLNNIPITKICDLNNTNCDSTDAYFLWAGSGWFGNSRCNAGFQTGAYKGNYGYCHNGINTTYNSNSLFGNRSAYSESKLWNYSIPSASYQERIFIR